MGKIGTFLYNQDYYDNYDNDVQNKKFVTTPDCLHEMKKNMEDIIFTILSIMFKSNYKSKSYKKIQNIFQFKSSTNDDPTNTTFYTNMECSTDTFKLKYTKHMYELLQLLNCRVLPYKNISRDGNIAIETIKDLINSLEIKQNQI